MERGMLADTLIGQEKRSAKLFLVLFYVTYITYDLLFYFVLPLIRNQTLGLNEVPFLNVMCYFILLGLLPISIILMKKNNPRVIKYMYFIVFIVTMFISEFILYFGTDDKYASGNPVELLIVIFSPIFINKKYFWLVCVGTLLKYSIMGILLQAPNVVVPLIIVVGLSGVAFIVLNRFHGYVDAIGNYYSTHFEEVVKGIIATIELKDPYTRGHSERVAIYAEIMARELNIFSQETLQNFNYACLLHDVGKIHVSDVILTKPGPLTEEEYDEIKKHPVVGAEVVQGINGLQDTVDVIRYHHERWDGKGYPDQLKELETPLLARITAIADAFDAMTTVRSYRPALSPDVAYKRIVEGIETQFDPHLVDVFIKIFPKWVEQINQRKSE